MIPKILHIVWIGPHVPPKELIDSWDKKHINGWFFMLWKDHTGWENQKEIDWYYTRRQYNGAADIMRYEILRKHGGFAVDADSECLKALDEGPFDFLGSETAVACFENETLRPGMIGCGFLGAPKDSPFFKVCVGEVKLAGVTQQPPPPAWDAVGPGLMGRVAKNMPDQIRVYPSRTFNPTHYTGNVAPGDGPIYAKQGWGSTKGYNSLRKIPCTCPECMTTMLRPPWG